eukprot:1203854-Rhodomonas_salina.3
MSDMSCTVCTEKRRKGEWGGGKEVSEVKELCRPGRESTGGGSGREGVHASAEKSEVHGASGESTGRLR